MKLKHLPTLLCFVLFVTLGESQAQTTNPSPYCDAKFDDVDGTFPVADQIKSVTFGLWSNVSNAHYPFPHYVFYNNLSVPNLVKGTTYPLTLKFYVGGGAGYGVWIDYNRNNAFEANEKVAGSTANGWLTLGDNIQVSSNITIPATAQTGNTRIRIRIVEDDMYTAVNGANIAACNSGTTAEAIMDWGETEDYTINITGTTTNTPVVNSTTASAITAATATIAGSVNANGGPSCAVSFEYGTTTSYGSTANASPASVTGNTLTNVSANLTALLPLTTYHYRTKVVAGGQTYYGLDKTFTTSALSPIVNSTTVIAITAATATIGGSVNANGGPSCAVTFEYGTTTSYGSTANATPANVTGSTLTNVSANLTALLPLTTYHYRTKVVAGGQTYFGLDKTFTTASPTAVSELEEEMKWLVYPNPFQDRLHIQLPTTMKSAQFQLISVEGKTWLEGELSPGQSIISTENLPAGLFWMRLKEGKNIYLRQLVK